MTCCPGATGLDLRLASFFLRAIRCRLAQSSHLVWPGIEGEVQPTQSPAAFALSRLSCAWRRWYSLRSGRWPQFRSYSRRSCFGASGSLGWGVIGFLVALLGLAGRGFFPVLFVAFGPRRVFLGSAKVCSSVILLEYCAGVAQVLGKVVGAAAASWVCSASRMAGVASSCFPPFCSASC